MKFRSPQFWQKTAVPIRNMSFCVFFSLFSVSCEGEPHKVVGQKLTNINRSASSCERQICKINDWSVRYFPMDRRPPDFDRGSGDALDRFQGAHPIAFRGVFVGIAAIVETDPNRRAGIAKGSPIQRELNIDLLTEDGAPGEIVLPKGVTNPVIVGRHVVKLTSYSRVNRYSRELLDVHLKKNPSPQRLIGMGLSEQDEVFIFCVQDQSNRIAIDQASYSECLSIAAEI